jgi:hypothetical protein
MPKIEVDDDMIRVVATMIVLYMEGQALGKMPLTPGQRLDWGWRLFANGDLILIEDENGNQGIGPPPDRGVRRHRRRRHRVLVAHYLDMKARGLFDKFGVAA